MKIEIELVYKSLYNLFNIKIIELEKYLDEALIKS
jgi:hypothetical protein